MIGTLNPERDTLQEYWDRDANRRRINRELAKSDPSDMRGLYTRLLADPKVLRRITPEKRRAYEVLSRFGRSDDELFEEGYQNNPGYKRTGSIIGASLGAGAGGLGGYLLSKALTQKKLYRALATIGGATAGALGGASLGAMGGATVGGIKNMHNNSLNSPRNQYLADAVQSGDLV